MERNTSKEENVYLSIIKCINLNGHLPIDMGSKQRLNRYISHLKRKGIIAKRGYGVWEVLKPLEMPELNKMAHRLARKDFIKVTKIHTLRKLLEVNGLDKCLFCSNDLYDLHHIIHKADGGKDEASNLIPICPNHHKYIHRFGYTREMEFFITEYRKMIYKLDQPTENIRGHGFMFNIALPKIANWERRKSYMDKKGIEHKSHTNLNIQYIKSEESMIQLANNSIIIYLHKDFLSTTAEESKSYAVMYLLKTIGKIESLFSVSLKIKNQYRFKVSRQHYGKIRDLLAIQYNEKKEKLQVYNDSGLWFVIDNSYNLNEAETLHPKTADKDMDNAIVPFFNSLKEFYETTKEIPSYSLLMRYNLEMKNLVEQIIKVQLGDRGIMSDLSMNIKTHMEVLNGIKNAVNELAEQVKKLSEVK